MRSGITLVLFIALCGIAKADGFALTLDLGYADPQESNFDSAYSGSLAGGYRFGRYAAMIGYLHFDDFEFAGSGNTFVDVQGATATISAEFPVSAVAVLVGAGVYYWDAEAKFGGVKIGDETDTSAMLEARVVFPVVRWFDLYLGVQYFNDVAGSDINRFMFGARFSAEKS